MGSGTIEARSLRAHYKPSRCGCLLLARQGYGRRVVYSGSGQIGRKVTGHRSWNLDTRLDRETWHALQSSLQWDSTNHSADMRDISDSTPQGPLDVIHSTG